MKVAHHNATTHDVWIGGQMVPAGETRHVDPAHLPRRSATAPAVAHEPPPGPEERAAGLAQLTVHDIRAALADLDAETLRALAEIDARKGTQEAVGAELLSRASLDDDADD